MSNTLLTLFDTDRYHEHYRTGSWRDDTVYALVRAHAERAPERIALRSASGDLTYGSLIMHVDAFASDLARKGVSVGQRVAVWLPSRAETVIALLACSRNGYVCCPSLAPRPYGRRELNLLNRMRAAAIVAEEAYGADATKNDLFAQLSGDRSRCSTFIRLEKNAAGREIGIVAVPPDRRSAAAAVKRQPRSSISPSRPVRPACQKA